MVLSYEKDLMMKYIWMLWVNDDYCKYIWPTRAVWKITTIDLFNVRYIDAEAQIVNREDPQKVFPIRWEISLDNLTGAIWMKDRKYPTEEMVKDWYEEHDEDGCTGWKHPDEDEECDDDE